MSERLEALLQEARNLEGVHDAAAILEKALEKFVEVRRKQRFSQTDRPQAQAREVSTDAIPNRVKREVYLRDGGACSFVGEQRSRSWEKSAFKRLDREPAYAGMPSLLC